MSAEALTLQALADSIAGYDPKALSVEHAQAFIAKLVPVITQTEWIDLAVQPGAALGRVLAEAVISPINVPAHDNSAMDGYAVRAADLAAQQDTPLRVVGTALAGAPWSGSVGAFEAVKITTGAVMPHGLDTVVPQEFTRLETAGSIATGTGTGTEARAPGAAWVVVPAGVVRAGDNRRLCGEDLQRGRSAVPSGTVLGPAELGLIASLGIAQVKLYRRLRVAYFSTGDEIHSLGEDLSPGGVYDSNRYTVRGMLERLGMEVLDLGVIRDDPEALTEAFAQASRADAVITSGGVSVGEADHTKQTMAQLGDVLFWRIAMRPGRPMAIGRLGSSLAHAVDSDPPTNGSKPGAILFGLPGNPVAVMVTFYALVRNALLRMSGASPQPFAVMRARSSSAIRKKPGRTEYQRGIVTQAADGQLHVAIVGNQGSGVLSSMSLANGMVVLDHASGDVQPGDWVSVWPFRGLI